MNTAKDVASGCRFVLGLSIVIFFGVLTLLVDSENPIDVEKKNLLSVLAIVTVEKILVSKQRAAVEAFAEVKPRWVTDLKSEVSGLAIHIHGAALAGNRVSTDGIVFTGSTDQDCCERELAMYFLTAWFIRNPVAANLLMVVILLMGAATLATMRIEGFPRIAPESVSVTTSYPGAPAQKVDQLVSRKIETAMEGLKGVRGITALSHNGLSEILVRRAGKILTNY